MERWEQSPSVFDVIWIHLPKEKPTIVFDRKGKPIKSTFLCLHSKYEKAKQILKKPNPALF